MKKMFPFVRKGISAVNNALYFIAMIALIVMVVCILGSTICAWIDIGFPLPVDFAGYMLLIAVVCGYPGFQYKRGFVRVDILIHNLTGKKRRVFDAIASLFSLALYFLLIFALGKYFLGKFESGVLMSSMQFPLWPFSFLALICFIWTTVITLFQLAEDVTGNYEVVTKDLEETQD